jgi:hypothetical protein
MSFKASKSHKLKHFSRPTRFFLLIRWQCERNAIQTFKCTGALSIVVKTPDDSTTYSAPKLPQGISAGSLEIKKQKMKNLQ